MIHHRDDLLAALSGSSLAGRPVRRDGEVWFVDDVEPDRVLDAWRAAREVVPQTGRWPVVVQGDWYLDASLDPARVDELQRAAETIRAAAVFAWENELPETEEGLARFVRHRFPQHPELTARMVRELGVPTTEPAMDRWLYTALLSEPALRDEVDIDYLIGTRQWHEPSGAVSVALLPTEHSWLSSAWLMFNGADEEARATALIAAQRQWAERYGAELVAHWGTMLQLVVERPPADPEEAYELAGLHKDIASSLQMYRYELALALQTSHAWFLHDRP